MNFFFNSFHFLLALNYYYVGSKEFLEFTFQAMALGHSGLLITWELTEPSSRRLYETSCGNYRFIFNACIVGTNTTIKTNETIKHYSSNETRSCDSQYKIHSLNESTYYEVRIQQAGFLSFVDNNVPLKTYFVKGKTNVKTNSMPAKPHFEYLPPGTPSNYMNWGKIRWYPCGKERNCHDKEPGTHFGVHIKELESLMKSSDVSEEELFDDDYFCLFWPGRLYEVMVYSINGEYKTYSDPGEIFLQPSSTPVQHVNILSLPNSSVLISWEPPKHSFEPLLGYVVYYHDSIEFDPTTDLIYKRSSNPTGILLSSWRQKRISDIKPVDIYTCSIAFLGRSGLGFVFRMKHTHQDYDDNLPIARPDFNYHLLQYNNDDVRCRLLFQWLPCGQSFDCKNTKPGSGYVYKIEPDAPGNNYKEKGSYDGMFKRNVEYNVTLTSSVGNNFSEPITKKFKNCSIY